MFLLAFSGFAHAVCNLADPVLIASANNNVNLHPDCYLEPIGQEDIQDPTPATDTWLLALDSDDVRDIIDGTCAIEIDNDAAAWTERARSPLGSTNNKMLEREVVTTTRMVSLTVYGATTLVLTPDQTPCSGEESNQDYSLLWQVPSCPTGGSTLLPDGTTTADCIDEQSAPVLWTSLGTGSLDVPDLSEDNIRDAVMMAVQSLGSNVCYDETYPAVDIVWEREVATHGYCVSLNGNIEGQLNVTRPADPSVIEVSPAFSCIDAEADLSLFDCYP